MIKLAPKSTKPRLRRWWHAGVRFIRGVAMLEDTPRRIALGSAVGIFFASQPFVGSQMAAAALTSKLMRASVLASLPWTWLTNPVTVAPFYYGSYCLGRVFWGGEASGYERFQAIGAKIEEMGFMDFLQGGWRDLLGLVAHIAIPLQIGSVIIGGITAVGGFFFMRWLVVAVQRRRQERRSRWSAVLAAAVPRPAQESAP